MKLQTIGKFWKKKKSEKDLEEQELNPIMTW